MEEQMNSDRGSAAGEPCAVYKKRKFSSNRIKLSVGDSIIVADKQRLVDISSYFVSLFKFHSDEALPTVSMVPPEDVDMDCFLAVVNTLANPNVKLNITTTNFRDCVTLSDYFQVEQMKDECMNALREILPTVPMDELVRLWRHWHAYAIVKATTVAAGAISLKMASASESAEFLDLKDDELVALMSSDSFLPLVEKDVCKAVKAWCDHDPENRKQMPVLKRILAEVVWDNTTRYVIKSIYRQYRKPDEMPKRVVSSDSHEIPDVDKRLLKKLRVSDGIVVGNFLYCFNNDQDDPCFCRIDKRSRQRDYPESIDTKVAVPHNPSRHNMCLIKLAGRDKIACLISRCHSFRYMYHAGCAANVVHAVGLYDVVAAEWRKLPCLSSFRFGCAMIQCGSFLYIIGGNEYRPLEGHGGANAHRCYRLDLTHFTDDEGKDGEWERIADLNAPRIQHSAKIQYGRIVVYGGQAVHAPLRVFERALWSEAYDPTLNSWTVFGSAS